MNNNPDKNNITKAVKGSLMIQGTALDAVLDSWFDIIKIRKTNHTKMELFLKMDKHYVLTFTDYSETLLRPARFYLGYQTAISKHLIGKQ